MDEDEEEGGEEEDEEAKQHLRATRDEHNESLHFSENSPSSHHHKKYRHLRWFDAKESTGARPL